MRHCAAELLLGDFLVRDSLDDVRASDEHVGSFAGHEDEIGDGRRIDGAAGAGAHNGANLRNDAARKRVAQKNIRVTSKRSDAFLDAGAAGIVQANYWSAGAHGKVHDFANLLRVGFGERAAEHSKVLCEDVNQAAVDSSKAGNEAVSCGPLLLHTKIHAAVADEFVELFKRALVEQQMDALARGQLAGLVFALAALGAAASLGFRFQATQLLRAVIGFGGFGGLGRGDQAAFGFRQRVLHWRGTWANPSTEALSGRRCGQRGAWQARWCQEEE